MINPFAMWARMMDAALELSRTGQKASETFAASHTVIDARSALIRGAMAEPLAADYAELARMVPEKVEAFSRAGSAVVTQWWAMQADMMTQAQKLAALSLKGRAPTAAEMNALATLNIAHGARLIERSVALSAGAVKPVHARATSNARRLKRRKKS